MGETAAVVAPRAEKVPMVEQEVVRRIRLLAEASWGNKRIARGVGVARNRVRRYLRAGSAADKQVRPKARRLTGAEQQRAVELSNGAAEGNAVVVKALLAQEGVEASVRTVQRAVEERHAGRCTRRRWPRCASRRSQGSRCRWTSARRRCGWEGRW